MKFIESVKKMLPGCAIALVIAVVAKFLEQLEESVGLPLIGASVIAMFIGMIVNRFYAPNDKTKPGIKFTSKKILQWAVILLGFGIVQIGLALKSHDAGQRAQGFMTFFGGVVIYFAKDILDMIL